ncbi:Electron transport complex protein RnfE [Clostridiaceae bacterium JG1575]|nr:Electron transport complex protein RnfE [Clostridiaceae bacterium JG1575]
MAKKETPLLEVFTRGILKENPVLMLLLGICPILAVSTTAINGIGMGIAATVVLIATNFIISCIRNLVSDKVRIPVYITVIAGMVTIIQLFIKANVPSLDESLGIFIPLITVNCIILGRAEAFASKNNPLRSVVDALGMGLGFTLALVILSSLREIFGNGTWFGKSIPVLSDHAFSIIAMPPGGFFIYGLMIAGTLGIIRFMENNARNKAKELAKGGTLTAQASVVEDGCSSSCASCQAGAACGMAEFRGQMTPKTKLWIPGNPKRPEGKE